MRSIGIVFLCQISVDQPTRIERRHDLFILHFDVLPHFGRNSIASSNPSHFRPEAFEYLGVRLREKLFRVSAAKVFRRFRVPFPLFHRRRRLLLLASLGPSKRKEEGCCSPSESLVVRRAGRDRVGSRVGRRRNESPASAAFLLLPRHPTPFRRPPLPFSPLSFAI